MSKKYFYKMQKTSDNTITCFYYNKSDDNYNNLDFLNQKIKDLIESQKTSDNTKKQLKRLQCVNLDYYDLFFIYSNTLKIAINHNDKIIDFYDNDYDLFIDKKLFESKNYQFNYNAKINTSINKNQKLIKQDIIDSSDLI